MIDDENIHDPAEAGFEDDPERGRFDESWAYSEDPDEVEEDDEDADEDADEDETDEEGEEPGSDEADPPSRSAGTGSYLVKDDDCISSIALETGHFWQTIWDNPGNQELKEIRKDPNVLKVGDRVHVPEVRPKTESGGTGRKHQFRRKGEPSRFRITIFDAEGPRANQPFRLFIDGQDPVAGKLDGEGTLEVGITAKARRGTLVVGPPSEEESYELSLGRLDPVDELTGAQQRLHNLGFLPGEITNELDPPTRMAVAAFQKEQDLAVTGELDQATLDRLDAEHD